MNKTYLNSNTFNPRLHSDKEVNIGPSMTVPDQSLTIPQILDMYTRGISMDQLLKPSTGFDDPDFDDLDPTQDPAFDIIEAKQMLEETRAKIADAQKPRQKTIDEAIDEAKKTDTE